MKQRDGKSKFVVVRKQSLVQKRVKIQPMQAKLRTYFRKSKRKYTVSRQMTQFLRTKQVRMPPQARQRVNPRQMEKKINLLMSRKHALQKVPQQVGTMKRYVESINENKVGLRRQKHGKHYYKYQSNYLPHIMEQKVKKCVYKAQKSIRELQNSAKKQRLIFNKDMFKWNLMGQQGLKRAYPTFKKNPLSGIKNAFQKCNKVVRKQANKAANYRKKYDDVFHQAVKSGNRLIRLRRLAREGENCSGRKLLVS